MEQQPRPPKPQPEQDVALQRELEAHIPLMQPLGYRYVRFYLLVVEGEKQTFWLPEGYDS